MLAEYNTFIRVARRRACTVNAFRPTPATSVVDRGTYGLTRSAFPVADTTPRGIVTLQDEAYDLRRSDRLDAASASLLCR